MNKRMNTVFFGICFLAAILTETYFIQLQNGDILSVAGIGAVVLLTGYLLLGSIRDLWIKNSEKMKFVLDKIYQEETQKWDERYTELLNMQKATYTATKKNTAMLQEQLDNISSRLEAFEKSSEKASLKMTELQKKSLEGQKNALNLEINYNKENTKQLIKVLREESSRINPKELNLIQDNSIQENSSMELPIKGNEEEISLPEAPAVVPLYDDPNKALTPDEIAGLFASFGK